MKITKFERKNEGWIVTVETDEGKIAHFGDSTPSFNGLAAFLQGYVENKLHY
jgi:hypothetical protein